MINRKRTKISKQYIKSLRLQSWGILCEECGTVYDQRTQEGLCRYCKESEKESSLAENIPGK